MVVSYTLARVVPAQDKAVYRELNDLDVVKEVFRDFVPAIGLRNTWKP